jgi:hypothetical protein
VLLVFSMKNKYLILGVLAIVVMLGGIWWYSSGGVQSEQGGVESFVQDFGKNIQHVNLRGEPNELAKGLNKYYGKFVDPSLLEQWSGGFLSAPGRIGASPRPDRIEISSTENVHPTTYRVIGVIISVINEGFKTDGDTAGTQPIALTIEDKEGMLLITEVVLGTYEPYDE